MNKILVIGPAWVGDMVIAQSLFKVLKQKNPEVCIDVLAPEWSMALLARMPEVSKAIRFPIAHGELALKKRFQMGIQLRKSDYSQAIVLPNSFKSALIPVWAHIPIRTGWKGEIRYGVLNDIRLLDKERYPLMVDRFIALGLERNETVTSFLRKSANPTEAILESHKPPASHAVESFIKLGATSQKTFPLALLPQLTVSEDSCQHALNKHSLARPTQPLLVLCPGAEFGSAKQWPAKYYAEVAMLQRKKGWDIWLLGSSKDTEVAKCIMLATQHGCIDLTGKTTLEEAIDLLSLATIVVTNDSGLMHVAAALKKSLIALYGPTSMEFTPPLCETAKILSLQLHCQPCFKRECPLIHHRCMKDLQPQRVVEMIDQWKPSCEF